MSKDQFLVHKIASTAVVGVLAAAAFTYVDKSHRDKDKPNTFENVYSAHAWTAITGLATACGLIAIWKSPTFEKIATSLGRSV